MPDDSNKNFNDDFSSLFGENSTNNSESVPDNNAFFVDEPSASQAPASFEQPNPYQAQVEQAQESAQQSYQPNGQQPAQQSYQPNGQQPAQQSYQPYGQQPAQQSYQPNGQQPAQQSYQPYGQQTNNPNASPYQTQAPYPMYSNFKPNASGSGFLKAAGILIIISSSFVVLGALLLFAASGIINEVLNEYLYSLPFQISFQILGVVIFIAGMISMIEGIIYVKFSNRPDRAVVCLVLSIIHLAFVGLGFLASLSGDSFSLLSLGSLVVPILALIGSIQNKRENDSAYLNGRKF